MAVLKQGSDNRESRHVVDGRPRRIRALTSIMLWLAITLVTPALTQAQPGSREYQLKAAFLYNFAQFTEWPTNAFPNDKSPLVIGVLGTDPFGKTLDDTVRGEKINGREILIRRFNRVDDTMDCHLLFISQSESDRLEQIFKTLKDRSILTVGETDAFIEKGGIIRFATEHNRIRLRINPEAARQAKLVISSKLLRLADTVRAERN